MKPLLAATVLMTSATIASGMVPMAAWAQGEANFAGRERIVVTGSRTPDTRGSRGGVSLTKRADSLLLEVRLINDSINPALRRQELIDTVQRVLDAADKDPMITVSLVGEYGYVENFDPDGGASQVQISSTRQNMSSVDIMIETAIPKAGADTNAQNETAVLKRIRTFVSSVKPVGRTAIRYLEAIQISIANPDQYRRDLMALIFDEIKYVKEGLGDGYRVQIADLSAPMTYGRSGALTVTFTIPYTYTVLPDSVEDVIIFNDL